MFILEFGIIFQIFISAFVFRDNHLVHVLFFDQFSSFREKFEYFESRPFVFILTFWSAVTLVSIYWKKVYFNYKITTSSSFVDMWFYKCKNHQ